MNTQTRWASLVATCGPVASLLRRKRSGRQEPRSSELHEWQNEGGNLAPPRRWLIPHDPRNGTEREA